jgi:phosphoinositide-3-kinase, regulatory subunit 4
VPMPENWDVNAGTSSVRPFLFVAAGANECSMFDVLSSTCAQCFRTVAGDSRNLNEHVDDPPKLIDISFNSKGRSGIVKAKKVQGESKYSPLLSSINCMVGSIGTNSSSYLITGGTDSFIRFWDFTTPSKCFVINGLNQIPARPTYERIDFDRNQHLMLCRQTQLQGLRDENKLPRKAFHGLAKPEQNHSDSILDLKLLDNNVIVSCSRDSTIKVWK